LVAVVVVVLLMLVVLKHRKVQAHLVLVTLTPVLLTLLGSPSAVVPLPTSVAEPT
jgi:hypothetical protein